MERSLGEMLKSIIRLNKPNQQPPRGRGNEGGRFMAIPEDQNLGTTEEEADIIAANANKDNLEK